jgi:Txe/YoeB family toxin of Txe-Axe toxin-antitoxin module
MYKAWSDEAWEDFEYWLSQDKRTLKRILQLLKDIERNAGAAERGFDTVLESKN